MQDLASHSHPTGRSPSDACVVRSSPATTTAPIGGVLFSIEVSANYFLVKLYWKCIFATISGALISRSLLSLVNFMRGCVHGSRAP